VEVDLPGATVTRYVDARYPGQSHELTIEEGADFHAAHEQCYGFRLDGDPEIVTRRMVATVSRPRPELPADGGEPVAGPAIVELPGSTCLVRPGWSGTNDAHGTLELKWTR
jgi:N-methylhydantoinase A